MGKLIILEEMSIFQHKPRHVTPQIDRLGKMHPVVRVSTHIYGVSKDIGGKMFIFQLNLGMWENTPQIDEHCSDGFIYGVFQEIDGKTFIFKNPGM